VEANSYEEACQKRDEFLEQAGFSFAPYSDPEAVQELQGLIRGDTNKPGRYRSERSASGEQTTRVTKIVYVDGDGNQQSFEVPGWIGITSDLAAHIEDIAARLAEAEATADLTTLAQIYVERPHDSSSNELTVVVLCRADGSGMRLLQEFAGRIDDHTLLATLVGRRLGPDIEGWRFVEVRAFQRGGKGEASIPSRPTTGIA
jgi:hypothetical protein